MRAKVCYNLSVSTDGLQNSCRLQRLTYHFAWGPMRARPLLTGACAERLKDLLHEKAGLLEVTLRALDIQPDRVYLVVDAPPMLSPHSIVCGFKAHTSGVLRREFKELTAIPTLWTREYVVAAGDAVTPEQVMARYAAMQPPRRPRGRPRRRPESASSAPSTT